MNIEFNTNPGKAVHGVTKSPFGNQTFLKWQTNDSTMFLAVFANSSESADLTLPLNQQKIQAIFDENADILIDSKTYADRDRGIELFLVSHADIMKGGLLLRERPGVYTVYAIDIEKQPAVLYLPGGEGKNLNKITMQVDVNIKTSPIYVEKKAFLGLKKVKEFSGFHSIQLERGYLGMTGDTLNYTIGNYTYSFPDAIVRGGGKFCVKAAENTKITFSTTNPGLKIK